jgi:hypothetical protein
MIMNTKSLCIKESQVIYRSYNLRTAGPILMISDLSPYKNKNNSNLGKNTDNYLDK